MDHLFLYFMSQAGRRILSLSSRKYGGNRDKYEPNDLNNSFVPTPEFFSSRISNADASDAVEEIIKTQIVPKWVERAFAALV